MTGEKKGSQKLRRVEGCEKKTAWNIYDMVLQVITVGIRFLERKTELN